MNITYNRVSQDRPWIVLIHGIAVTEKVWSSPLDEKILFISFKTLLKEEKDIVPIVARCREDYNIATWTQGQYSTIEEAAQELRTLTESLESNDIIFIAHSRGGLVARYAIQEYQLKPRALICLSTPHIGSMFANVIIRYFGSLHHIVPSITNFEVPLRELCMGSDFIQKINSSEGLAKEGHVDHYDIQGTSTAFFHIFFPLGSRKILLCNIMSSLERLFGRKTIDEWQNGKGDGFVSVASSRSPLTIDSKSFQLPVNHANILIDSTVWNVVKSILQRCFTPQFGVSSSEFEAKF
jgi:hypothetical protein